MNDTPSGPIIVGLLFVLRCLIPLGILFGVSYLLRRFKFVVENSDEALLTEIKEDAAMKPATPKAAGEGSVQKSPPETKKKQGGKKKSATSKKKEA